MRVAFDATVLVDFFNRKITGDRRAKLDDLVATLEKSRTKIVVPTPALTEVLIRAGKARQEIHNTLMGKSAFEIAPFDVKAAMECSLLLEDAWSAAEKRAITKTKFKFDWQIVAIAVTRQADTIYSDDSDISKAAARANIRVVQIDDLQLPPSAKQAKLDFPQ
jgi:predicted nucleic acid-binding protein